MELLTTLSKSPFSHPQTLSHGFNWKFERDRRAAGDPMTNDVASRFK